MIDTISKDENIRLCAMLLCMATERHGFDICPAGTAKKFVDAITIATLPCGRINVDCYALWYNLIATTGTHIVHITMSEFDGMLPHIN